MDFVDTEMVKELFKRKTGLTPIINDKKFADYDGNQKAFFPDNYVSVIGAGTLGNTWYGVTPEERTLLGDPKVDVSILDSGVAVAVATITVRRYSILQRHLRLCFRLTKEWIVYMF